MKREGKNNSNWKGGKRIDKKGRILIYSPKHPGPHIDKKYIYLYRLKMEKKIGRYLKKGEIVHHIDGNPKNNRITNLKIMTQSKHWAIHSAEQQRNKKIKRYDDNLEKYEKIICAYYQGLTRDKIKYIFNIGSYEFSDLLKTLKLEKRGIKGKYNPNYRHGRMCK